MIIEEWLNCYGIVTNFSSSCTTAKCEEIIVDTTNDTEKRVSLVAICDINGLRENDADNYEWFTSNFLPAVVGSRCWNAHYRKDTLSTFVSISDEAFALVCYENNYARWDDMFEKKNTKSSEIGVMWTNSGESIKNGQSKFFVVGPWGESSNITRIMLP